MKTGRICTLKEISVDADFRKELESGILVSDWLSGNHITHKKKEKRRITRELESMARIVKSREKSVVEGFRPLEEVFRDEPPRLIAERVLLGGTKDKIMEDLINAGIPLRTKKTPKEALIKDIPYVVKRLRLNGYDIIKDKFEYIWANNLNREV